MPARLACPECESDEIRQFGTIDASWGGEALEYDSGLRQWMDDHCGADVYWEATKILNYTCQNCGWSSSGGAFAGLDELHKKDVLTENDEPLPEGLKIVCHENGEVQIVDAQDVPWITFNEGGKGDPTYWRASIIEAVATVLGARREEE